MVEALKVNDKFEFETLKLQSKLGPQRALSTSHCPSGPFVRYLQVKVSFLFIYLSTMFGRSKEWEQRL